ncbi:MAG TPA: ATP-binding protein [Burkholderiaceae bacterium]|jgi:two-component system osmolarity sensor histidine kinase EnvZ|nr:ATP-binding protein [Burkholderiaceae bacterium]
MPRPHGISLFWRTFFFLSILLLGCILAWLQTFRALEFEPRTLQSAQQLGSLVNLSRAALKNADAIGRVALVKTLADEEGVKVLPREPKDQFKPYDQDALSRRVSEELTKRMGPGTLVAREVNGSEGLWVGFNIDADRYWLQADPARITVVAGTTWLVWLSIAVLLSLAGAALIARLINRPLKNLSFAASRVREGDFGASHLDEGVATSEIREVNIGFNRMAQRLSKVEQERALMLAGISHDLRTPLARLRLETEMSVADEQAKTHMAADIEQVNAIIDKFLDYARADHLSTTRISLNAAVDAAVFSLEHNEHLSVKLDLPDEMMVIGDAVELQRVFANLLENAIRYGRTPGTDKAEVEIGARIKDKTVLIKFRDRGPGVDAEQLTRLTQPFFRGDTARTSASGAGLGLAIVEKTIARMGGEFALANTGTGGLAAHIKLQRA